MNVVRRIATETIGEIYCQLLLLLFDKLTWIADFLEVSVTYVYGTYHWYAVAYQADVSFALLIIALVRVVALLWHKLR